jgi:murein DD-endopeptidase MepM/ murein hydrolase activator NlpD
MRRLVVRALAVVGIGLLAWAAAGLPGGVTGVPGAATGPAAWGSTAEEQRLEAARDKLERVRAEIEQLAEEREQRRASLQEAQARVAEVREAVHAAEMAVQRQEEAVRNARQRYEELQAEAKTRQQQMANRAAELYRQGTGVPMSAVLASDSVDDALTRTAYLEKVQRADQAGFEQVEADQVALDAQREVLQEEEEALRERLQQKEQILAEARVLRNERALQVAGVEEQLAELESEERHLESESRQLAAMARRASEQPAAARQASDTRAAPAGDSAVSAWQWPASGPVTSEYGMRWGRMHEGIDIGGSTGQAVVAARPGTVRHAGRMGGYGNLVLINHGEGVSTAYAHLSSFAVSPGQSVGGGQRIGGMGCSGSCTGPHVHFEVRLNGSPRNPREFLP